MLRRLLKRFLQNLHFIYFPFDYLLKLLMARGKKIKTFCFISDNYSQSKRIVFKKLFCNMIATKSCTSVEKNQFFCHQEKINYQSFKQQFHVLIIKLQQLRKLAKLHQKIKNMDRFPQQIISPKPELSNEYLTKSHIPNNTSALHHTSLNYSNLQANNQNLLPTQLRYVQVQDKYLNRCNQDTKVMLNLKEDLTMAQEEFRSIKRETQKSIDRTDEKLHTMDNTISEEVQEELQQIKTARKELIECIDKKYKTIKTDTMSIIGIQFEKQCQNSKQDLTSQIEKINFKIEQQNSERDEVVNFMIGSFEAEFAKVESLLARQKSQRIEKNGILLDKIAELENNYTSLSQAETKQGLSGVHKLQGLLEDLCFKIETNLLR